MNALRSPPVSKNPAASAKSIHAGALSIARHGAFPALTIGAACIAFSPIFVRLSELEPTATAVHRIALALPLVWLWMALTPIANDKASPRQTRGVSRYWGFAVAGLFFAGDLVCWHWSIQFTTVANSTLLANFAPVFVTLAGFFIFGERFSRRFIGGLVLAMAGAIVLMGESLTISADRLFGDALGLATALFYAGYIVSIGRLRAHYGYSTAEIMLWSGIVTVLVLVVIAILSGEALIPETTYGWLILFGLAWISQAGGQSLITYALAHLPAALSSVTLLLQPVIAALLAWVILAEPIGPLQAVGATIIIFGIALARGARFSRRTDDA